MMLYEKIGAKIKKLRESKGWSQQELAEKLNYESSTAVHLIEKGERKLNIETLKAITDLFEISLDDFLERKKTYKTDLYTALRAEKMQDSDIEQVRNFIEFMKSKKDDKPKSQI